MMNFWSSFGILLLTTPAVFGFNLNPNHGADLFKQCRVGSQGKSSGVRIIASKMAADLPSRRFAVGAAFTLAFQAIGAKQSIAAALSGADPEDKTRLLKVSEAINDLGGKLGNQDAWPEIVQTLSQPPYTKEALDKLFSLAAKSLPPNIQKIYGGDGGQWVGLKNEAVDAMDALAAEIKYLDTQRKQGSASLDTTDLQGYYELLKSKTDEFLALYSNKKLNATLKGVGFCAYSSSAKCDAFDDDADVKEAARQGGIYNEFRFGSRERAVGGGVSADSVSIKAYGQESLLDR